MRWLSAALGLPFLVGCLQITTGTGDGTGGGGGSGGSGGSAASGSGSGDAGPSGSGCTEDPQSQVILCEQIDSCPGVVVDQGLYPGCGFRLHGAAAIDLECVCADELCPVGVASTCADAQQLLAAQSSLLVCQQASEGRCLPLGAPDAGSASSPCSACAAQCGGSPGCFQACGC